MEQMEEVVRVIRETKMSKIMLVRSVTGSLVVWKEATRDRTHKTEVKALRLLKGRSDIVQIDKVINVGGSRFIQMEYIEGKSLDNFIDERKGKIPEDDAREIFTMLIKALLYCHRKGVFHRDLKPGNIMISNSKEKSEKYVVKLIDFGVSCFGCDDTFFEKSHGTEEYVAPEMIMEQPYQASKVDVFSLGIVLFELLTGLMPWPNGTRIKMIREENRHPVVVFPAEKSEILSDEAKGLVVSMLEPSPRDRPTLELVVQHPWLKITDFSSFIPKKKKKTIVSSIFGKSSTKGSDYLS